MTEFADSVIQSNDQNHRYWLICGCIASDKSCIWFQGFLNNAAVKHGVHLVSLHIDRLMFLWPQFFPPCPFLLLSFPISPSLSPSFFSFLPFPIIFLSLDLALPFFKLSFYSGFYFLFSSLLLTSLTSHVSHLSDLSSLTFMSFTLCLPPTSPSPYTYPFLPLPIRTMIRPKKRFWNTKLALAS